jgi:ABC-2 type transport system permease protein
MTAVGPAAIACVALLVRDLRAFLRSRSQLYSSLLLPLMLLAILGTGVKEGLDPSRVPDGDYVTYLVPGIIAMTAFFSSTFSSASFYHDRDSGMLKVFLASPHSPRVVMLGKSLSATVIGCVQALVILVIAVVMPAIHLKWQFGWVASVFLALLAILLLNVFLAGLGQALASRIRTMQGFHLVMNLVLFPLLFLSGAFFPLSDLPEWLKTLGRLNPLSYAVDLLHLALRAETTKGYFGLPLDITVMGVLAIAVFYWGWRRGPQTQ